MDSPKEKRLEAIRAAARKHSGQSSHKPKGIHRTTHQVELPRRKDPWSRYVIRDKEGGCRHPAPIGGFSTFEIPNHYYFEDYLPRKTKELGERYGKKGPTALTKIAHAKPEKIGRVPPWQKNRRKLGQK